MIIKDKMENELFEHEKQVSIPTSLFISTGCSKRFEPAITKEDEVIIESLEEVWERLE